jgi:hypothetical protein
MAIVSFSNGTIESRKLSKNGNDAWCFVLDLLLLDETTITANTVDDSDLRTGGELIVQPSGHTFFPGMRTKF